MRGQVVPQRGEQGAVEVVDRRPSPEEGVVRPDRLQPLARDAATTRHVLQERHDVLRPLRPPERDQQQRVVRRDVGSGHCSIVALRSPDDVHPLPCRARPSRCPPVQRDRDGRPAADLDRHARHRAARHGPRPVLRPGRRAHRGVHDRQRADGDRAGPSARPARPGAGAARRRLGVRGRDRPARGQPSRRAGPTWRRSWPRRPPARRYPPIGSCVRARWSYVLAGEATEIQTAYALESVIDEAIFIIGPTVATVLATTWRPWAGLAIALVSGVGGSLYLATQRSTQPDPHPPAHQTGARPPMPWRCGAAAGRGLLRARLDVRRRRGRHRRVLRRAGRQVVRRRPARAVGARQHARRAADRRPRAGAGRRSFRVQVGSVGAGPGDAAARVRRLDGR